MALQFNVYRLIVALGATLMTANVQALAPDAAPVPATRSVAEADAKLAEVSRQRAVVEARHGDSERVCYTKFFVNNCLDVAREQRRVALAALRAIDIEASHFKRADAVFQRDRALAERGVSEAEEGARRSALPARVPAPERTPSARAVTDPARRAAKIARQPSAEAADAAKRAANVAAFEKKQRDAAARQREIADKQAEKARAAAARAP